MIESGCFDNFEVFFIVNFIQLHYEKNVGFKFYLKGFSS